jgi:hypothetical protein
MKRIGMYFLAAAFVLASRGAVLTQQSSTAPQMSQSTQTQQITPAPVPKHCPYPFIDISKLLPFLLSGH